MPHQQLMCGPQRPHADMVLYPHPCTLCLLKKIAKFSSCLALVGPLLRVFDISFYWAVWARRSLKCLQSSVIYRDRIRNATLPMLRITRSVLFFLIVDSESRSRPKDRRSRFFDVSHRAGDIFPWHGKTVFFLTPACSRSSTPDNSSDARLVPVLGQIPCKWHGTIFRFTVWLLSIPTSWSKMGRISRIFRIETVIFNRDIHDSFFP